MIIKLVDSSFAGSCLNAFNYWILAFANLDLDDEDVVIDIDLHLHYISHTILVTFEVTDGRKVLVPDVGLEPMTLGTSVRCSTISASQATGPRPCSQPYITTLPPTLCLL